MEINHKELKKAYFYILMLLSLACFAIHFPRKAAWEDWLKKVYSCGMLEPQ